MDLTPAQIMMEHEVADLRKEITNNFNYMKEKLELILQQSEDKLDLILEQTTKHNGRMTKIETERLPKLETWQTEMNTISRITKYAFTFLAAYIFVATGILFNMWADWRDMDRSIREAVRAEVIGLTLEESK